MKPLFVSATNTDIGKTYIASLIAQYCQQQGIKTILSKPIETGDDGSNLLDCQKHLATNQLTFPHLCLEDINFYRFSLPASPFVAQLQESCKPPIDFAHIKSKLEILSQQCEMLIVEGAGGILVPIDFKNTMLDLAKYLNAHILLISSDKLGMINDLALNVEFLESKGVSYSVGINVRDLDSFSKISKPYIEVYSKQRNKPMYILQQEMPALFREIQSFLA